MPADAYTQLTRQAINHTLEEGGVLSIKLSSLDKSLHLEGGVIISLYRDPGMRLRGQAGDILPIYETIAEEIVDLAPRAAIRDMRFDPIEKDELKELSIVVDIVKETEEIRDIREFDPIEKGLFIVSSLAKSAFIIPGTAGVSMGEQALNLAIAKADIDPDEEKVTLFSFTVDRHAEVLF